MKQILLILFAIISMNGFSQERFNSYREPISKIIAEISNGWKIDSFGKNGFRSRVFDLLRNSKIDNISKQDLFKYLGKPIKISRFYSGIRNKNYVGYRYYLFCDTYYPIDKYFMGSYIEFVFDETETNFIEIEVGDY